MAKKYISIIFLFFTLLLGAVLRFYQLSEVPPGLNQDEISIGINSYDLLHRGKDEHGVFYPLFFQSLADFKLPGYIYVTSLSIKLFGPTPFAVRFPSAFFGSISIVVLYFLARELVWKNKNKFIVQMFPLLSSLLLAISPWHIFFSRVAFESITALFFFLTGLLFSFLFLRKQQLWLLLLSVLFFSFSVYTYHIYRMLTPIVVVLLGFGYLNIMKKNVYPTLISVVLFFLLTFPMTSSLISGQGFARVSQTTVVSTNGSLMSKAVLYAKNYLSYFSPVFLFGYGDRDGQHQVPTTAPMNRWEFPFVLLGIWALLKSDKKTKVLIFSFLFLAPFASAFALPSPHTLRGLPMLIPLLFLVSLGLCYGVRLLGNKKLLFILFIGIFSIIELYQYLHVYFYSYPSTNYADWGGASKTFTEEYATWKDIKGF